jgi:hypothetical protein
MLWLYDYAVILEYNTVALWIPINWGVAYAKLTVASPWGIGLIRAGLGAYGAKLI